MLSYLFKKNHRHETGNLTLASYRYLAISSSLAGRPVGSHEVTVVESLLTWAL